MAKKKRKTTTAADGRQQQQQNNANSRTGDGGSGGGGGGIPFKTFPLHLVPSERPGSIDDDGKGCYYRKNISTLTELCKGRVWVVPSFFTRQECQSWIDFCESTSTLESSYQINRATAYTAHRECYRLQQPDATTLASRIFERLRSTRISSCPEGTSSPSSRTTESVVDRLMRETEDILYDDAGRISAGNGNALRRQQIVGCNPNLRVYKYSNGHSFGRHVDESNNVPGQGMTGMTVLIYLSECQGGATRFYTNGIYDEDEQKQQQIRQLQQKTASTSKPSAGKKKKNGSRTPSSSSPSSSSSSSFAFQPTIGSMLLHVHGEHCLEHEAEPVLGGNKYVLRTDLVFGQDRKE